jgi:hypothetical protein
MRISSKTRFMISVHEHHFPMQELVVARYQRLEAHFEDDQRFRREQVPEDTFPKVTPQ